MKTILLRWLLTLALRLMLSNTKVQELLGEVGASTREDTDKHTKRNLVNMALRDTEGWSKSEAEINLITEMGVNLYRSVVSKEKK